MGARPCGLKDAGGLSGGNRQGVVASCGADRRRQPPSVCYWPKYCGYRPSIRLRAPSRRPCSMSARAVAVVIVDVLLTGLTVLRCYSRRWMSIIA